jgi:O-antigen/teichoic acid export membrane protein
LTSFLLATAAFVLPAAALFVYLVVRSRSGLDGYFTTMFIGTAIQIAVLVVLCHRELRLSFDVRLLRRGLLFAVPLVPTVFIAAFMTSLGRYLLIAYANMEQVAQFAVATRIASALNLVFTPFLMAWQPFSMSVMKRADAADVYVRVTRVAMFGLALAGAALIWLSPETVRVVAGPGYRDAAVGVSLIVIGALIGQLLFFVHLPITIAEKSHLLLYAQILAVLTYFATGIALTKAGGVTGTAASFCLANAVLVGSTYLFGRKTSAIRFPVGRFAAVVVGLLIASGLVSATNLPVNVRCAGAALSACAVAATLLVKSDVQWLNGSWRVSR